MALFFHFPHFLVMADESRNAWLASQVQSGFEGTIVDSDGAEETSQQNELFQKFLLLEMQAQLLSYFAAHAAERNEEDTVRLDGIRCFSFFMKLCFFFLIFICLSLEY